MKLRNRLIALACLLLFAGVGVIYFKTWVVQKPFGIILFTGDGLNTGTLTAARLYAGGASHRLAFEKLPCIALASNEGEDYAVPDAASAATALATGSRTAHGSLGVTADGVPLETLLDLAIKSGRATGIVTNGTLADPLPAAFYAHYQGETSPDKTIAQLADDPRITLLLGGGARHFLPESKEGARTDGRDLLIEMRQKGYEIMRTKADLENTPAWTFPKVLALFSEGPLPHSNELEAGGAQPSLSDLVRSAISLLQFHRGGYFLVVDASLIQSAAQQNRGELTLVETLELDRAIQTARAYAGENTLIVATGKLHAGRLALNGFPRRKDSGVALLGTMPSGVPSITWSTGPNGPKPAEPAAGVDPEAPQAPEAEQEREPAAFYAEQGLPVAEDVLVGGVGPGSEKIGGFLHLTDLFKILSAQM
jgi:alkaline phosphatase